MKCLIFDAGPLINFSMNGLLHYLPELKKDFDGKFLITRAVKYEILDRPIRTPRFELGALRIKQLLAMKVLELPNSLGIMEGHLRKATKEFMSIANSSVMSRERPVNIVSEAEMSCLALANELARKKIESLIAIDERTTRILSENPKSLEILMSKKLHHHVKVDEGRLQIFKGFRFIRSSELAYVLYKKGLFNLNGKESLEALLYATKFKGSSISFDEIKILKKL
jgi:hypothetical protein